MRPYTPRNMSQPGASCPPRPLRGQKVVRPRMHQVPPPVEQVGPSVRLLDSLCDVALHLHWPPARVRSPLVRAPRSISPSGRAWVFLRLGPQSSLAFAQRRVWCRIAVEPFRGPRAPLGTRSPRPRHTLGLARPTEPVETVTNPARIGLGPPVVSRLTCVQVLTSRKLLRRHPHRGRSAPLKRETLDLSLCCPGPAARQLAPPPRKKHR